MALNETPAEPPPSYTQATGTPTASQPTRTSHLEVPHSTNGIPAAARKSMEDEGRKVPPGWIRQFDHKENHQFFVDTTKTPPRSIWHHPYDDEQYLASLSSEERERIQDEEAEMMRPLTPASVDEKTHHKETSTPHQPFPELPERPGRTVSTDAGRKKGLGERLKEKATGMTKEEREAEKRKRAAEEAEYYKQHMKLRTAMAEAARTGKPVFFSKDRDGHDVFVEPPNYGYGGGLGGGAYGYQQRGFSPYSNGIYNQPNARYMRPSYGYNRGYGGYGGGYYGGGGMGMGMPLAGGLLGGALLGAALF